MGTERNESAGWGAQQREQQRELIDSLTGAVATLAACMDRLQHLIDRATALAEDAESAPAPRRTQISLGGGPSVLGGRGRFGGDSPDVAPQVSDLFPDDRRERDRREGDRPEGDRFGGEHLTGDQLGGNRLGDRLGAGRRSENRLSHAEHRFEDRLSQADHRFEDRPAPADRRARDDHRAQDERVAPDAPAPVDHGERLARQRAEHRRAGTAELMAVSEMVHLGYSREEIAERLRARWGDQAMSILRDALD